MTKSTFYLNVVRTKGAPFFKLSLYPFQIKEPCKYGDLAGILEPLSLPFAFSQGIIYFAEDSKTAVEALKKAGLNLKSLQRKTFDEAYKSPNRKLLYEILNKAFEGHIHKKGFEISRRHKRRHERTALPIISLHIGKDLVRRGRTDKAEYIVKEGFSPFFTIHPDGGITLRIEPKPTITIPSNPQSRSYDLAPECTAQHCPKFKECRIHKLGPVTTPKETASETEPVCTETKNLKPMYCYKTRSFVGIPPEMLYVEASPHNLRILGIYSSEYNTLNKDPKSKFDLTKQLLSIISEKQNLAFPLTKDLVLEFEKDFVTFEVDPWK